ncbi:MAG: hypothetical protein KIS85_02765 [Anaerolineales bacterium]|nr:hypothetical protein [Anaerolineales bacterium]
MRLGRVLIIVSIILILALLALYAFLNLGLTGNGQQAEIQTTDIVIVVQPIGRGSEITAEALGYLAYPTQHTSANMLTDINQAVGRLARYDLEPDQPLLVNMVVNTVEEVATGGSDTSLAIPSGMVAFPIPIDRFSSLAYGLQAGDHVNVIVTLLLTELDPNTQTRLPNHAALLLPPGESVVVAGEGTESQSVQTVPETLSAQVVPGQIPVPYGQLIMDEVSGQPFYVVPSENQRPRLVSQTLLQNIVILHVGDFAPQQVADPSGEGQTVIFTPPDLLTLIVTPQDAVTLNYLLFAGGELTLALRSSTDDSTASTEAVTLEYLLSSYNIPVPSKLPFGLEPRIESLIPPTQQNQQPPAP